MPAPEPLALSAHVHFSCAYRVSLRGGMLRHLQVLSDAPSRTFVLGIGGFVAGFGLGSDCG
jgi:hypothetical protein